MVFCERHHETEGSTKFRLADRELKSTTAVASRGEVGIADLFALGADEL